MKTKSSVEPSGKSKSTAASTPPVILKTPFSTCAQSDTLPTVYDTLVPTYQSQSFKHLSLHVRRWTNKFSTGVRAISKKRASNRLTNYLIMEEIERARKKLAAGKDSVSIRFGKEKTGQGYHGERGDFCLIGAAIHNRDLTLFYRSLELIGGLAYDLCIIEELSLLLKIEWRSVTIHAAKASVFALKGNSNEKLYPKFRKVLGL